MKKLVILDFDGVIADTEASYPEIHISFFEQRNVPFTEPEVRKMAGRSLLSIMTEMQTRYALDESPEELKQANIAHIHAYFTKNPPPLVKGVPTLLAQLKKNNIPFCLASSNSKTVIATILQQTGLSAYFDVIISGDQVKEGKPNPEIFLLAARAMQTPPENCIVIEDTFNGVLAAKNAGMYCIGYQNPNTGNQDLSAANVIVKDGLTDVFSLINPNK